jgi:predicted acylesterase/phospholipase RssA
MSGARESNRSRSPAADVVLLKHTQQERESFEHFGQHSILVQESRNVEESVLIEIYLICPEVMLHDVLQLEDYALCLSPGFFRFYALTGVIVALEENHCLRVTSCSGSSAGALVSAFIASGMAPKDMPERVFSVKKDHIWDVHPGFGLLKGHLFQGILEDQLPVTTFEECRIPVGITAFDVFGFKTRCITSGDLATAVRASCTFPGLFHPVMIDSRPHIDGGVFDDAGLMALPCIPPSNLIVNVVCDRSRISSSVLPEKYKNARVRQKRLTSDTM